MILPQDIKTVKELRDATERALTQIRAEALSGKIPTHRIDGSGRPHLFLDGENLKLYNPDDKTERTVTLI